MPLYEYECGCGRKFESIKSIADRDNVVCGCGVTARRKVSSWGRVIFANFFRVIDGAGREIHNSQITERTPYVDSSGREF